MRPQGLFTGHCAMLVRVLLSTQRDEIVWRPDKVKIGFENALGPHAHALQLRAQRTEILAQNIANADTPGYLARDMDFSKVLARQLDGAQGGSSGLKATHNKHINQTSISAGMSEPLKYRMPIMPSFDGNTVDVQTEQAQFAENNLQFQASLRFLDGKFKGLMTAIKGE